MSGPEIVFSVAFDERADWPVDGTDVVIAAYDVGPIIAPKILTRVGLQLGEDMARRLDTHLHHADYILTSSIESVRKYGLMPEHEQCHECIVGVERGVVELEQYPDRTLLVGQLYWASGPETRHAPGE